MKEDMELGLSSRQVKKNHHEIFFEKGCQNSGLVVDGTLVLNHIKATTKMNTVTSTGMTTVYILL